jgi:glycerol-3-phosphate dehydrogenase
VISRADALAAMQRETFDLVVVGGGITGAGVALDAASRGYSVALVERHDYAAGTSSRSSKLVHGGLRYLQNFDLGLVREALLERSLMVRLAPHLVRPLPLLVPSFGGKRPDRLTGVGLNMYDVMAAERLRPGRRRKKPEDGQEDWSPDRHRTFSA